MTYIAAYSVPLILAAAGLLFIFSKNDLFSEFLLGARDGLRTAVELVPTLVALIVCISMFRASGALDIITDMISPVFALIGIPREIIAFILMRPFSGSGSTAMLNELFKQYGADSFAGRAASVIMGSTDTVFYIFAVYFGAAGIKKTRYAAPAALLTQLFSAAAACFLVAALFN